MIDEFAKWIDENSITEVECLITDLGGIARGKILPSKKFLKGLEDDSHRLPQSVFMQTISGGYATDDNEDLPIDVYNPTDIDVILRPDFKTIRNVSNHKYFRKCFKYYSPKKAQGNKLIFLLIKYKMIPFAYLYAFYIAFKRYK